MKTSNRKIIHLGINFLTIPRPIISQQTVLSFQQAIINNGLEYSRVDQIPEKLSIIRNSPSPLEISVISSNQPLGQIIVIAPEPKTPLDLFMKEACAAIASFNNVWGDPNRKIIGGDSTLRELIETTSQHAFQELWESRLGQQAKSLAVFNRPIRGGGLRFVLDPEPNAQQSSQMEVKVESYLKDSTKIFVEVQSGWHYQNPQSDFDVEDKLGEVESFLEKKVHKFLSGDVGND